MLFITTAVELTLKKKLHHSKPAIHQKLIEFVVGYV